MDIIYEMAHPKGTPLNYKKYKDFYFDSGNPGQWCFRFPNNYGASVIKHPGSYGYDKDLFELAVILFIDDEWHLTYETPITDDVIGNLTNEEVLNYLKQIKDLKGSDE